MLQAHLSKHAHLCVEKWKAETLWEIQNLLLIFFLPINSEGLEYKNGPGKEHVCAGQPQVGEVSVRVAGGDMAAAGISEGTVHSHS